MHNPFDQLLINAQNEHDLALAEGRAFAVVDIDAIRDEFAIAWDAAARENYCGSETGWAGSAVVAITPRHKGNTRLGKRERAALTALGATYAGRGRRAPQVRLRRPRALVAANGAPLIATIMIPSRGSS
jgi:hypothetical protein